MKSKIRLVEENPEAAKLEEVLELARTSEDVIVMVKSGDQTQSIVNGNVQTLLTMALAILEYIKPEYDKAVLQMIDANFQACCKEQSEEATKREDACG